MIETILVVMICDVSISCFVFIVHGRQACCCELNRANTCVVLVLTLRYLKLQKLLNTEREEERIREAEESNGEETKSQNHDGDCFAENTTRIFA